MLVLDKCVLFSIPPCKYFFFLGPVENLEEQAVFHLA